MELFRYRSAKYLDALLDVPPGGVYDNVLVIPWMVIPRDDLAPSRQSRAGNVGYSCFHPAPMFVGVRTRNLDFNGTYLCAVRDFDPSIARERNGIHRIRNHRSADTEVIRGDRVAHAITGVVQWADHP